MPKPPTIENKKDSTGEYTAKDIYVLEGLEPVRKRPGMYIGSTGPAGLHHLIWEVVDNSIDEAMAGFCNEIEVILLPNNRISVKDNGRGIPVETHAVTKKSALETVMTTLHAGGKFGGKGYQVSGGLHGVGVSVVNALSVYLKAEVCREGYKYEQEYKRGVPKSKVKKVGTTKERGTTITFEADEEIFKEIKFSWDQIIDHLRQQAYLTKGVKIIIKDERTEEERNDKKRIENHYTFYFDGGIVSFVRHLMANENAKHPTLFYLEKEHSGIFVETAFQYSDEINSKELSFANNIYTPEGGMHLTGFRTALTRAINNYAKKNSYLKEKDSGLSGEDVREGLVVVISIKLREPQFEGQTKAKLGNPEARTAVENLVNVALEDYLEKNPSDARAIMEKVILAQRARQAAKTARETVLRKGALEGLTLPGKLADCSNRKSEESELFIVEGDSAGGCFSGDTMVALVDGRNLNFRELITEQECGIQNYCYTMKEDGVGIGEIKNVRKTKSGAKVIKIILDNDQEIICTPDHKFLLRDGEYIQAQYLKKDNSIMPLYKQYSKKGKRITIEGYEMIFDPLQSRWVFTHLLSDEYNLEQGVYLKEGVHRHHVDFNKLNNNPNNISRLSEKEHLDLHRKFAEKNLSRPEVLEKLKMLRRTPEFRLAMSKKMSSPKMRKMLSLRAKRQWQNAEYKKFMIQRFFEFCNTNSAYRKSNKEMLYKIQQEYWDKLENREKQSQRVKKYFISHSSQKKILSKMAIQQWRDNDLRLWRSNKTKEQWTEEFREQRKESYNKTYLKKGLQVMKAIYDKYGLVNEELYNKERKRLNDKSVIRMDTICEKFFESDVKKMKEAVFNFNHKIKSIEEMELKMDVFDLEVPGTHNFALAAGVFVHNSAKQGRDRTFQAILPLRGKILNVEKARIDKMLSSKEVRALIIALGTAIGEEFDLSRLRYNRIILMTDADVDGAHIRTLLLTLFYRHLPELVNTGHLYIAKPPLYRVQKGKLVKYAYSDEERDDLVKEFRGKDNAVNIGIQRYKGLGEMNPTQLWETTMDPQNRVIRQVGIEDAEKASEIFDILMGDEVAPRRKFIQTHAKTVKDLDV